MNERHEKQQGNRNTEINLSYGRPESVPGVCVSQDSLGPQKSLFSHVHRRGYPWMEEMRAYQNWHSWLLEAKPTLYFPLSQRNTTGSQESSDDLVTGNDLHFSLLKLPVNGQINTS